MIQFDLIRATDPQVAEAMELELKRQRDHLELIASENFVSEAVMAAMGSHLTNKYAEGYPGKRYYGGCECVDIVENLARERACRLFGAEHANVQPHSGAQANLAVYFALLNYGDTVLGMNLSHGGHLTHGSPVNMSGKYYNFVAYGVDPETEMIDYDEVRRLALVHKPKMIVAGASAYPRAIDFAKLREIADETGALFMVDMAHIAGLVAAGLHMNPVPYADVVTTTTHKTLRGPRGGMILCKEALAKQIDKAIFPGTQGGPLMHTIAAKAVCLQEALQPEFKAYQQQVVKNAGALAKGLMARGVKLVSGGTDNHLMLVDLGAEGRTGKEVEALLDAANITANKNTVPGETRSRCAGSEGRRVGADGEIPAVRIKKHKKQITIKKQGLQPLLLHMREEAWKLEIGCAGCWPPPIELLQDCAASILCALKWALPKQCIQKQEQENMRGVKQIKEVFEPAPALTVVQKQEGKRENHEAHMPEFRNACGAGKKEREAKTCEGHKLPFPAGDKIPKNPKGHKRGGVIKPPQAGQQRIERAGGVQAGFRVADFGKDTVRGMRFRNAPKNDCKKHDSCFDAGFPILARDRLAERVEKHDAKRGEEERGKGVRNAAKAERGLCEQVQ